ncbi:hypothetical protein [Halogeometricum sp. CBA1124]|uniref:hypothetical protein n=1 Tax=Halogeometricum sp. CBA1124 TaxID=2668071 RepID=UPI00142B8117|nr:hypothetical protein [Halogeometricum sp. CBA1124]MUV56234.1 hypothetical protein [Halogeometricum sp. CBA1124]
MVSETEHSNNQSLMNNLRTTVELVLGSVETPIPHFELSDLTVCDHNQGVIVFPTASNGFIDVSQQAALTEADIRWEFAMDDKLPNNEDQNRIIVTGAGDSNCSSSKAETPRPVTDEATLNNLLCRHFAGRHEILFYTAYDTQIEFQKEIDLASESIEVIGEGEDYVVIAGNEPLNGIVRKFSTGTWTDETTCAITRSIQLLHNDLAEQIIDEDDLWNAHDPFDVAIVFME